MLQGACEGDLNLDTHVLGFLDVLCDGCFIPDGAFEFGVDICHLALL